MIIARLCLLLSFGLGCGDPRPPDDPTPALEPVWSEAFDASGAGSLAGVWGSSPDDVFIVGGKSDAGEIYHYDGERWRGATLPTVPLLIWVYGFGPDDVYAVGVSGAMVHYDGEAWSAIETGTDLNLWGVFGFAPDDLWIVGGDPFEGAPILLHYDGTRFEPAPIPAGPEHALFKVWGIDGRVFAVGQQGLILGYDAGAWTRYDAGAEADADFVSLWGTSGDHIVAVGGRSGARIAKFDGARWETRAPSAFAGLNGVHMERDDEAIIGGIFGFAGRYVPSSGAMVREADGLTDLDIHAVWGDGDGTHYAVGGTFAEPHRGVVLRRSLR